MKPPRKAFILAAGLGTRMRPLTDQLPKPLMPFWGKPLLQHSIDLLKSWGVEDICINCHWKAEQVIQWVVNNPQDGVRISLSYEPELLGSGGVFPKASWAIDDKPFWVLNSDVVAKVDPARLLKAYNKKSIAALWMKDDCGPCTVDLKNGRVSNFRSKSPGGKNTATFTGLHLMNPAVLKYLPPEGFSSIITAYQKAMKAGWKVEGVTVPKSYWSDLGRPETYLEAHLECRPKSLHSSISKTAKVSPKAEIINSVIWDHADIRAGAKVHHAVVGEHCIVRGSVEHIAVPAAIVLKVTEQHILSAWKWNLAGTTASLLAPRASNRSFIRLSSAKASAILIRYQSERAENLQYAEHTRFLSKRGVRVPALLADAPAEGFSIYEDLGTKDLLAAVEKASDSKKETFYKAALDEIVLFHQQQPKTLKLEPAFTPKVYAWEHDYFISHFLKGHLQWNDKQIAPLHTVLKKAAQNLNKQPKVLIHRDLQSTNIMLTKDRPAFIDYQGMRMGAAAYDIASFLADPYVSLSETLQNKLISHYEDQSGSAIREIYPYACIQRLGQALGAYARLGTTPGTERFIEHIPEATKQLNRAIKSLDLKIKISIGAFH